MVVSGCLKIGHIIYPYVAKCSDFFLTQNSFPMRDWHVKNMENIVVKYVTGLSENATRYEVKIHKRYGGIEKVCRRIKYDMRHGVKNDEVLSFLERIRTDSSFSHLRELDGYLDRLNEIEEHFVNNIT